MKQHSLGNGGTLSWTLGPLALAPTGPELLQGGDNPRTPARPQRPSTGPGRPPVRDPCFLPEVLHSHDPVGLMTG